jgi:DNA repair photolyase
MGKSNLKVVTARRSKLLVDTGFSNYDLCFNSYVGCQFGCSYCYVRFFLKDKDSAWGDFVRVRNYVADRLPKETGKLAGKRLVLGTMTDPYQPAERQHRITRQALEIIAALPAAQQPSTVGIFTRSPIILDDISLLQRIPQPTVHISITPYPRQLMRQIESVPIHTDTRFKMAEKLTAAGISVKFNVAPAIPFVSDPMTEEYAQRIVQAGAVEFFVDPMQMYKESFAQLTLALRNDPIWPMVRDTMTHKLAYQTWKDAYWKDWQNAWAKYGSPKTLPIWCDHVNNVWKHLVTGQDL